MGGGGSKPRTLLTFSRLPQAALGQQPCVNTSGLCVLVRSPVDLLICARNPPLNTHARAKSKSHNTDFNEPTSSSPCTKVRTHTFSALLFLRLDRSGVGGIFSSACVVRASESTAFESGDILERGDAISPRTDEVLPVAFQVTGGAARSLETHG